MLIEHNGKSPTVDPAAWIAPNAAVCGDVTIGPGCRIQYGAQVIAEGGRIKIGPECIVMQNAVLRSTERHQLTIGANCLIGPGSHIVGCTIEPECFIATGAAIFHGATIGTGSEVRVHAIVHLRTQLKPRTIVPIGWIAVGDPAQLFAPGEHDRIWAVQEPLNFPLAVYGVDRTEADMVTVTRRLSKALSAHREDRVQP